MWLEGWLFLREHVINKTMSHGRMLAVHDISCVGRCSLTVALPIISAVGIECSVLPTAVLSTHTGGFTGFTYRDLTEDIVPIKDHWKSLGLKYEAFYTGFLGSFEQIDLVKNLVSELSDKGTTIYVDPVMGDAGKLYSIFGPDFPKEMRKLCEKADVLMPNLTELCFMMGMEYKDGPYTKEYIDSIFKAAEAFGLKKIVITGVSFEKGKVGAVFKDYETGETGCVMRHMIEGYYHGTGDVFGSALVGALESGVPLKDSVRIAVDFTVGSIKRTYESGADVRYGVDFEQGLEEYARQVRVRKNGVTFEKVTDDKGVARVSGLAARIWTEYWTDKIGEGQTEYMISKFQSFKSISDAISDGYEYIIVKSGDNDIGYLGFHRESDKVFLSKIYLEKDYRCLGLSSDCLRMLKEKVESEGFHKIYLTVNRGNKHSIDVYLHTGFVIVESVDNPIGNGYEMNDYILEWSF